MPTDPIELSAAERAFLQERDFFYTRKAIREKLRRLLTALRDALLPLCEDAARWHAPDGVDTTRGQLAGGEYYRDLPYVYLDLPKHFSREATFTFRWMAWWGHYLFFAFVSQGPAMSRHVERLLEAWDAYTAHGLFIGQSEDLWDWRAEPGILMPLVPERREAARELLARHPFLKVMQVVPFDDPAVADGRVLDEAVAFFTRLKPLFAPEDS
ncbi:MAG: hypothetical protein ACE5KY_01535 [Candidatus Tectimicrobiota bacterium]